MNVVVLATASRIGGALTIYKQLLDHLETEVGSDHYVILLNRTMPMPKIKGVSYLIVDTTNIWSRLLFDFCKGKILLKQIGIEPDVLVSLQNTGLFRNSLPQIVYYHQSIPLYPQDWSFFRRKERMLFYYKHIYPFFVKITRNEKTQYVVQIPFIKKGLVEKFRFPSESVHICFPDVEAIDVNGIEAYEWADDCAHFLYPANGASYKMHITLIKALQQLQCEKIRLHLTVEKGKYPILERMITEAGLDDVIIREGIISHEKLLSMYKAASGLLFPSTIETIGLPLLEAASFGLPIIAADLDYAHEVLGDYEGVTFVESDDVNQWVINLYRIIDTPKKYKPIAQRSSSWPLFFDFVRNCAERR